MKNKFEFPEITVMIFDVEDVLASSNEGQGGEGEFPIG